MFCDVKPVSIISLSLLYAAPDPSPRMTVSCLIFVCNCARRLVEALLTADFSSLPSPSPFFLFLSLRSSVWKIRVDRDSQVSSFVLWYLGPTCWQWLSALSSTSNGSWPIVHDKGRCGLQNLRLPSLQRKDGVRAASCCRAWHPEGAVDVDPGPLEEPRQQSGSMILSLTKALPTDKGTSTVMALAISK